jgi:rhomboid protease GluP
MRENRPLIVYSVLAINLLIWVITEFIGGSRDPLILRQLGAITYLDINNGEYWRFFSAIFLHVGAVHLAVNCLSLLIMGGLLERIFGHFRFTTVYIVSGVAGSAFSYSMIPFLGVGAGASGAIFGCVGALAGFFLINRSSMGEMGKQNLNAVLVLAGINFTFGFIMPGIDNWAHLGGFVVGAILGLGITPRTGDLNSFSIERRTPDSWLTSITVRSLLAILVTALVIFSAIWLGHTRLN